MARLTRVDAELVRRGLARSRGQASELIGAGRVLVDGAAATKAATQIDPAQAVRVLDAPDDDPDYVGRGARKLAGALDALGDLAPVVAGMQALDAGASTGGFTDVLLRRGAARVHAVDVGYGQLAWSLRQDPRVRVLDRTNIRTLDPALIDPPVDLVVGDLSFISLTLVLQPLAAVTRHNAAMLLMVKPQFEVGKDRLGAGGVVREPELHVESVTDVVDAAATLDWHLHAAAPSPLPGPSGNVEYFVLLRRAPVAAVADDLVRRAVEARPVVAQAGVR